MITTTISVLLNLSLGLVCASASAQSTVAPVHVYAFETALDQVTLTWDAPPGGKKPASYDIYRFEKKIGSTAQTAYDDKGLQMGTGYAYSVTAVSPAGVESPHSAVVDAIMPFTVDGGSLCGPRSASPLGKVEALAVRAMLPTMLADADKYDDLISHLSPSTSRDFLRMSIRMLRSVPVALRCDPDSLAWVLTTSNLRAIQDALPYFYLHAKNGTDPYKNAFSGVVPMPSPIDGYIDFYVFRLPADYNPTKKYPLYLDLHAASYCRWEAGGLSLPIAKPNLSPGSGQGSSETIYLSPCARGPETSFAVMAQESVFDAIADATKRFSVDTDRITVRGASMGGTGALRLSTLYPSVFAGAGALTSGPSYGVPPRDSRYDATVLTPNLENVSTVLWAATGDPATLALEKPVAETLHMLHASHPDRYDFRFYVDPAGRHGVVNKAMIDEGERVLASASRNRYPSSVHYITGSEQYDGAYWVSGMMRRDVNAQGEIDVVALGDKITVKSSNLNSFALDLGHDNPLFKMQRKVTVAIDGDLLTVVPGQIIRFVKKATWTTTTTQASQTEKRKGVSGPIADVFMHYPVLMVYGTKQGNDAVRGQVMVDELLQAYFEAPQALGSVFHYGPFEIKADNEVTDLDIHTKNLVLFGTPAQNSMVARIAPRLPFQFNSTGGKIGGKPFGGTTGWSIVHPDPLFPDRYILLVSEHMNMATVSISTVNRNVLQNDWVLVVPYSGYSVRRIQDHGTFSSSWK